MPNNDSPNVFLSWLEGRAAEVRRIEQEALEKLARGESDAYRSGMLSKAELLAGLPRGALPLLAALTPGLQAESKERLWRFAQNAAQALSLNSVFYMSALLYPEKHREGEPNDLEIFLEELRTSISKKNA